MDFSKEKPAGGRVLREEQLLSDGTPVGFRLLQESGAGGRYAVEVISGTQERRAFESPDLPEAAHFYGMLLRDRALPGTVTYGGAGGEPVKK